jgi:hypothetical protein
MDINIHAVKEIRLEPLFVHDDFYSREIIIIDEKGVEITICLFSKNDVLNLKV